MNALDLIRGFEGYRDRPYWDVNAYRVGYGSDTTTLPDGSVVRVQPGMTVDRAGAERDLSRRVQTEFVPLAMRAVGDRAWGALGEGQRAALTSIAYNYGRLPDSVVQAVQSGDMGAAAQAIAALGSDNKGVNANRRNAEARVFAGGQFDGGQPPQQNALGGDRMAMAQNLLAAFRPQPQLLDAQAFAQPVNQFRNYLG